MFYIGKELQRLSNTDIKDGKFRYLSILNSSTEAVQIFSADGNIDCNQATLTLFGLEAKDKFKKSTLDDFSVHVQPDGTESRVKARKMLHVAYMNGFHNFLWHHRRADGREFMAAVTLSSIVHEGKIAWLSVIKDIDQEDRLVKENGRLYADLLYNLEKERCLNEVLRISTSPEDLDKRLKKVLALVVKIPQDSGLQQGMIFLVGSDVNVSEGISLEEASSLRHDLENYFGTQQDGGVSYIKAASREIMSCRDNLGAYYVMPLASERKLLGGMLILLPKGYKQKRRELDFLGAVGTIISSMVNTALVEKKLKEQRVKLLSSSKMATLGEMASGIAHEIKNPLAVISGYNCVLRQMIQEQACDWDELGKINEAVSQTIKRITQIIDGLRHFSRNGVGDSMCAVDLKAIVEETLTFARSKFQRANVELMIAPIPSTFSISCKRTQISQVVLNLLSNACDAVEEMPSRWVKLECRERDSFVELMVTDSGPGVPEEIYQKIMEPFFTTKSIDKGTGLGLSISSEIVAQHGGMLFLDRSAAQTCFVMRLPRYQEKDDDKKAGK